MQLNDVKDIESLKAWMAENNIRGGHLAAMDREDSEPKPYLWKWDVVEACMTKMIDVVALDEELVIRRNLGLLNPDNARGVTSIGLGLQCVMPGEQAVSHRHSAAAIRFVVKGTSNAFNLGSGEPMPFEEGDLITNPALTFHGHVNHGDEPVMWLDALDGRFSRLNHGFRENYDGEEPVQTELVGFSNKTLGHVRPSWINRAQQPPPFRYPWAQTEAALNAMREAEDEPDAHDGYCLTYLHPLTGGPTLPTMACEIQLLPPRFKGQPHRHNSTAAYHVFRGRGATIVDGQHLEWAKGDFITVPNWAEHRHENPSGEDAVLFSVADWPTMKALGLYDDEASLAGKGLSVAGS